MIRPDGRKVRKAKRLIALMERILHFIHVFGNFRAANVSMDGARIAFINKPGKSKESDMKYLLSLLLIVPMVAAAQESEAGSVAPAAPCSSQKHRQFDFWIGDWNVTSAGQQAGTNSIYPIHKGCALQENWQGAGEGGLSGTSFNIYDQANDKWHQTWIDSSGTLLELDGGLVDGVMVLSGRRPKRDGSGLALHRISWTPNEDGSVRQYWEASEDDGHSWSVLFDGLYVKQSEEP